MLALITVTPVGIFMLVKLVQALNAEAPIVVTPDGRTMDVKAVLLQP